MRNKSLAAAMGLTLYAVCALAALPAFAQSGATESYSGDTDDAVQGVGQPTDAATAAVTPQPDAAASPVATASPVDAAASQAEGGSDGVALNPNESLQDQIAGMENRVLAQQDQISRLKDALAQVGAQSNAQFGEAMPEEGKKEVGSGDMLFDGA